MRGMATMVHPRWGHPDAQPVFAMIDTLRYMQPGAAILENVEGAKSLTVSLTFNRMVSLGIARLRGRARGCVVCGCGV